MKFQNLKNQVKDLEEFYQVDLSETAINKSGKINNHVLTARANYIDALRNLLTRSNWLQAVKTDMSAKDKKERVMRMREKNKRMKEIQVDGSQGYSLKSTEIKENSENIHVQRPPERVLGTENGDARQFNVDERPIGGSGLPNTNIQPVGSSEIMKFNFSPQNTKPKKTKREFLKKSSGLRNRLANQKIKEEKKNEEIKEQEENRQSSPSKDSKNSGQRKAFLRKKDRLKYDPLKAVREAKEKKKREIENKKKKNLQEESEAPKNVAKDPSEANNIINYDDDELVNLMSVNLSQSIEMRKMSKENSIRLGMSEKRQKLSQKNVVNNKTIEKKPSPPAVSNQFQDLKYLKTIPKRVDCWLPTKSKKPVKTPKGKKGKVLKTNEEKVDFSKTTKIYGKLPSQRYLDSSEAK